MNMQPATLFPGLDGYSRSLASDLLAIVGEFSPSGGKQIEEMGAPGILLRIHVI
jgi:hypothetical protein